MSKISDIQSKYKRLLEIYANKDLDSSGAEAKTIISELASAKAIDYKTAINEAQRHLEPKHKIYTRRVDSVVIAARKNLPSTENITVSSPVVTTKARKAARTAKKDKAENKNVNKTNKERVTKPLTDKQKENLAKYILVASAANIDLTKIDGSNYKMSLMMLEEEYKMAALKDAERYIFGKNSDEYSDTLGDYMDAEDLSLKQKDIRLSAILEVIELAASDKNINPDNAVVLANAIAQMSKKYDIAAKAWTIIGKIDTVATQRYAEQIKKEKEFPKDTFLHNIYKQRSDYNSEFIDAIITRHIRGVLNQLDSKQTQKYKSLLKGNDFGIYLPLAKAEPLRKLPERPIPKDTNTTLNTNHKITQNTGDKKMTELTDNDDNKPKFTLTKAQLWAAEKAKINWEKCADIEEVLSKIETAGYSVVGDKVLLKGENEDGKDKVIAEYDKEKDKMIENKADEKKDDDKELKVGVISDESKNLPQPTNMKKWVLKKIQNYQAMEAAGKIKKFEPNLEIKDHFEAKVDGVTVTYSSPDSVKVSENADIKTFETIINEPDNQNRTINFTEGMPHETAVLLRAACLLNGRKITGDVPEFSPEDMQKLAANLGADRFKQLTDAMNPQNQPQQPVIENKTNSEEREIIINSPEDLDKVLADAQKARKDLKDKFDKGFIGFKENPKTKENEIIAGPKLQDNPDKEKILEEAKANGDLLVAITKAHDKYNKKKLEQIRSNMDPDKLAEHDKLKGEKDNDGKYVTSENRKQLREQNKKDMSIKLGLDADNKDSALKDAELKEYIDKNKITIKNYADLWKEANNGKDFDVKQLNETQKSVFMQISKAQLDRRNSLLGKDNSNTR
ncbi:MAG: hypothetical protein IJS88_01230 [Alphaproteobacteria bacterium]|nr:hypothetical protein [Alphaproteobacteria bacterium]